MAIRKSTDEEFVVNSAREEWQDRAVAAMGNAGFRDVKQNTTLAQVSGQYRKMTTRGELVVTLIPASEQQTRLKLPACQGRQHLRAPSQPHGSDHLGFKAALS